jgi:UDP-glucose 4-epimerase
MTISLVTGGAGFIGSHLVEHLLESGHEVRVIDNMATGKLSNLPSVLKESKLHIHLQDINQMSVDHTIFKDVDYMFHLAGIPSIRPSLENAEPYMKTNVYGTCRMLEAARHAKVKKFVYAASSACYGEADMHPTPETAAIKLQHPYGLTKYQGEETTMHWGEVFDVQVISLRMFDVYGRRADSTVLNIFLKQKAAGKPFTVTGDGLQTRDFVHVKDVARAYLLAATSDVRGEIFNVGTGKPETIKHLVDLLGGQITYIPKRGNEPMQHCADISKIGNILGWSPKITFEEGIADVIKGFNARAAA